MRISRQTLGLAIALSLVAATLAPARGNAKGEDQLKRARARYEAGRALYTLGDYEKALEEFVAGYQLSPRPEFLLNSGQALRRLERLDEAQAMFEKFMREAPPDDPNRQQVVQLLAELRRHRAEVRPRPPRPEPVPVAPAVAATAPAPVLAPVPVQSVERLVNATSDRPRASFARRNWWIFPVGAVVLAGAAVGLYFALRPSVDCGATPLGCVDARHSMP